MTEAKIVLSAEDKTRAAIAAAKANLAGLQGSAESLNASFGSFGKVFGAAFAGLSFTAFVRSTAGGIDKLNDLKDATGASVENISALEDVALRTGGSIDTVSTSLVKFNAVLKDTEAGKQNDSIFKQLGLDAQELKKLDPAEALRQTAVALAGFADDGNKARIVQELFGKSIKEAAPFLNDLATQSKLVATLTTAAALEAEKFTQQINRLEKDSLDLARALVGPVVAGINETIAAFKAAREQGDSFLQFVTDRYNQSNGFAQRSAAERTKELAGELTRIDALLDKGVMMDQRRNELLQKRLILQGQLNNVKIADAVKLAEGVGQDPALRPKSLGPLPADKPKEKKGSAKVKTGIEGLLLDRQEAFRAGELALQQTVEEALRTSQLTAAEQLRAEAVKNTVAQYTLLQGQYDRLNELIGATPTAKLEEAQDDMLLLAAAFERGTITAEQFNEAATARLDIGPKLKEQVDELNAFAEQAGRNIQDALGNTVEATLKGNFDNIGKLWGDLLLRMASEAAAAQLGKELLGDFAKSGNIGGSLGSLLGLLGGLPSFDVGTDYVPRDMIALVHKGERITPASENRPGSGGGGRQLVVNHTTINHIDSRTDQAVVGQLVAAGVQQGQRQMLEHLKATGAL